MQKTTRPNKETLDRLYNTDRKTTNEIAKIYSVNPRTVSKWLKFHSIKSWHAKIIRPDKATLERWYIDERKTLPEIADICGASYPAIRRWFIKFGITRRTNGEAQELYNNTADIDHKEVIAMYQSGKTQKEIAALFGLQQTTIGQWLRKSGIQGIKSHAGPKNGMYGRTHTPEAREKIRQANKRQFDNPENRQKHAVITAKNIVEGKFKNAFNKLETKVAQNFTEQGIKFVWQYRLSKYVFDFYLPESNTLVEVNGTYWHADPRFYDHNQLSSTQQRNIANDVKKAELAKSKGYNLVIIWEADV